MAMIIKMLCKKTACSSTLQRCTARAWIASKMAATRLRRCASRSQRGLFDVAEAAVVVPRRCLARSPSSRRSTPDADTGTF